MKYLFITTFCLFSSFTFSFDNFQKFINLREKIYEHKQEGLSEVPIFNILDQYSRSKKMKMANKNLTLFLKDRSKFSDFENELINSIVTLDKSSEYSFKKNGTGIDSDFYTTPFGMRISVRCFEQAERSYKSKKIEISNLTSENFDDFVYGLYSDNLKELGLMSIERKLLEQIAVSVKKMNTCAKNYPSIKKYVKKWMKSLKVTRLFCTEELASHTGVLGVAQPDYMPLFMDKNLYLPPESFLTLIGQKTHENSTFSEARNTFIHEVFHLAFADNKDIHLHNSTKIHDVSPTCDEKDRLSDRVYFLSNLCTGNKDWVEKDSEFLKAGNHYDFDEVMALKIKKCGMRSACLRHFSDQKNAKVFCKEIQEMGECKSNSTLQIKPPQKILESMKVVFSKLGKYLQPCTDVLLTKRPTGCPSKRYLSLPSNNILLDFFKLYQNQSIYGVKGLMFDLGSMTFLSQHPKTKSFLSPSRWAGIIDYIENGTNSGITKYCREKINIRKAIELKNGESCKQN